MSIGRATKIVAGILFVVAALGVSTPVLLVPLGLAVWVLGEAA
jgi:F0F1-type ATP synthase assembly protein I